MRHILVFLILGKAVAACCAQTVSSKPQQKSMDFEQTILQLKESPQGLIFISNNGVRYYSDNDSKIILTEKGKIVISYSGIKPREYRGKYFVDSTGLIRLILSESRQDWPASVRLRRSGREIYLVSADSARRHLWLWKHQEPFRQVK